MEYISTLTQHLVIQGLRVVVVVNGQALTLGQSVEAAENRRVFHPRLDRGYVEHIVC
jgi:hypothetical protein